MCARRQSIGVEVLFALSCTVCGAGVERVGLGGFGHHQIFCGRARFSYHRKHVPQRSGHACPRLPQNRSVPVCSGCHPGRVTGLLWDDVKDLFDPHTMGSLPNLRVPDTAVDDRQALLDLIVERGWLRRGTSAPGTGRAVWSWPREVS